MEVTGKLIQVLPVQTGEGKNGTWKKQDIILELEGTPTKKLCLGLWNDKIISDLVEGSILKVSFEIESREYNNKWYTNLKAWKVEELSEMGLPKVEQKGLSFDSPKEDKDFPYIDSDLPFDKEPFDKGVPF